MSAIDALSADEILRARLGEAGRRVIADRRLTWKHNAERVVERFRMSGVDDIGSKAVAEAGQVVVRAFPSPFS